MEREKKNNKNKDIMRIIRTRLQYPEIITVLSNKIPQITGNSSYTELY